MKYVANSMENSIELMRKENHAIGRIKSDLLFIDSLKTKPENEEEEESFNALDSPDFMVEYIEEEKKITNPPSVFFKRSGISNESPSLESLLN